MILSSQKNNNRMKAFSYIILYTLVTLLAIASCISSYAQEVNPGLNKLNNELNNFPKNKVFIKTDKDIYSPGEKIWFKAEVFNCLTEEHATETELVVLLKAGSGEVITDNRYYLANGICNNELTIPSWASEGNMYLVAYTPKAIQVNDASLAAIEPVTINSYRRNDYIIDLSVGRKTYKPDDDIKLTVQLTAVTPSIKHEKVLISLCNYNRKILEMKAPITVNEPTEFKFKLPEKIESGLYFEVSLYGKQNFSKKIPVYTTDDNINIEFYPEGGTLLTNTLQRILYRATDPFGEPIYISGTIYDQLGNKAGLGKNLKKGYGLISLMPMPNQKYFFKVEDEYGRNQRFEIPEAQLDGSIFTLVKTEDSTLRAAVVTDGKYVKDTLTLAAIAGGKIYMTTTIDGNKKDNLKISTAIFPQGIIDFVIFSSSGEILSERMVYNTPNEDSKIGIETKLKLSDKNGDADITIDLNNFIRRFGKSTVDVCICDKFNLYTPNETNDQSFLKYPLLTPVPKTVLEIYLTNLELVANEYKHYSLKELLTGKDYLKQEAGKTFSGTVTDKNHRFVPNAKVMALQPNNLILATTTTDENGHFSFDNVKRSKDITVKAFNYSGKKSYSVHLNRTFDESLDEIILNESFRHRPIFDLNNLVEYCQQNRDLLKMIGSESKKASSQKISNTEKFLESGNSILDMIKMTKPYKLDGNQIVFYGSENSFNYQSGALIVIDGQKMGTDIGVLNSISPFDVKSINISTNPLDIQRYTGLNSVGIIEINLKNNVSDRLPPSNESNFHIPEELDPTKIPSNIWKYQTTLLWKTDIPVDESGKVNLKIHLSEIKSDFIIRVDAVSESGIKHHEVTFFSTNRDQRNLP